MARRMPTVGAAMRILEGLVTPHGSTYTSNETARERNGGTAREQESQPQQRERERVKGMNEISLAVCLLSSSLPSSVHRFTISVFARERGSFSLSVSALSVCTWMCTDVCATRRGREGTRRKRKTGGGERVAGKWRYGRR